MKGVDQVVPMHFSDARHESWLVWAESTAADDSLKQALANSVLRPLLQPLSLADYRLRAQDSGQPGGQQQQQQRPSTRERCEPTRTERLVRCFTVQMLHGCSMQSKGVGSSMCTVRFCKSNPGYSGKLEHKSRLAVCMMAMELARKAMEWPEYSELQPHDSMQLALFDSAVASVAEPPATPLGDEEKSFARMYTKNIQRLLGYKLSVKTTSGNVPSTIGAKSESLDARKLCTDQQARALSPAMKTIVAAALSHGQANRLQQFVKTDTPTLTEQGQTPSLGCHCVCDGDGKSDGPELAVSRLDSQSAPLVAGIGGSLLRNTLGLVFCSPTRLGHCFVATSSTELGRAGPFEMDISAAMSFFGAVFRFGPTSSTAGLVNIVCRSLRQCLAEIEASIRHIALWPAVADTTARALAICALFVTANVEGKDIAMLQMWVARLVVQFAYGAERPAGTDKPNAQEPSGSLVRGWYAVFARDSSMRRQWVQWWARVPAVVVRRWIAVLEADAADSVTQLFGGITSNGIIGCRVASDPIRWVGSLELLRLLYEANEKVLSYTATCGGRLALSGEAADGDTAMVQRIEFCSAGILAYFDMRKELLWWMDRMRHCSDPLGELGRVWNMDGDNAFSPFYYPFLFGFDDKVKLYVFESYERMRQRYLGAHDRQAELLQNQRLLNIDGHAEQTVRPNVAPGWPLLSSNRMAVTGAGSPYLVLSIRRNQLVQDAMDMLSAGMGHLRFPLKVRFVAGGEDGVDMGGVQKELFAVLLPQLLSPERGLFVFANNSSATDSGIESTGGMGGDLLWPNAASPHELRSFELVGALLGVAFVNGISLDSATAPLAPLLVRQLAYGGYGENASQWPLDLLMDSVGQSFPGLVSGLQQLLDWDEPTMGSIEDVFCRSFDITVPDPLQLWMRRAHDAYAQGSRTRLLEPFSHLPLPELAAGDSAGTATFPLGDIGADEAVTSANRHNYIRRYLEFVAFDYVKPQVDALRCGFDKAAGGIVYRMLSPDDLNEWLCGNQNDIFIDPTELERIAGYEDEYTPKHPVVKMFWKVVHGFSQPQLAKLLAFVTASDRIPFGGYDRITFVVQRNGPDTIRLPSALTCFGRLLLPAYSTKIKLREKLLTAIDNASGFGLV